jgi:translation initiation factor IF-2
VAKKRVHEIAKAQGLSSKELLAALQKAGVEAKAAASSVEEADALKALSGNGATAEKAAPKPAPAAKKPAGAAKKRRVVIDSQASRRDQMGGPPPQRPPRREAAGAAGRCSRSRRSEPRSRPSWKRPRSTPARPCARSPSCSAWAAPR